MEVGRSKQRLEVKTAKPRRTSEERVEQLATEQFSISELRLLIDESLLTLDVFSNFQFGVRTRRNRSWACRCGGRDVEPLFDVQNSVCSASSCDPYSSHCADRDGLLLPNA